MVGRAVSLDIDRSEPIDPQPRLVVENLTVCDSDGINRLNGVSFTAYSGEILGIAGISGSGSKRIIGSHCRIAVLPNLQQDQVFTGERGRKRTLRHASAGH